MLKYVIRHGFDNKQPTYTCKLIAGALYDGLNTSYEPLEPYLLTSFNFNAIMDNISQAL